MKKQRFILFVILALSASVMMAQRNWLSEVEDLMDKGEFKKAETLMKSLSKKERTAEEVRIDSLNTIMTRIRKDFNMKPDSGINLIKQKMPTVSAEQIAKWKRGKKIEYMIIDGEEWWFRKSVRNLWLLADELKENHDADKLKTYNIRRKYYLEAMQSPADEKGCRDWHHMNITFTLDVKADAVITRGDISSSVGFGNLYWAQ